VVATFEFAVHVCVAKNCNSPVLAEAETRLPR
jgi:hypothetical protein